MGMFGHKGWLSKTWKSIKGGSNVYIGTSAPIYEDRIDNYNQSMELAETDMNGGTHMANYATTSMDEKEKEGTWYDRNSDWVNPMVAAGVETAGNIYMQNQQNEFNKKEAEKQRMWETNMANTAHQREIADLNAAGLNPLLSASGGAGAETPGGSAATSAGNIPMPSLSNAFANTAAALKTTLESKWISPEKKSMIANTAANTVLTEEQTKNTTAERGKITQETALIREQAKQIKIDNITRDDMNRIDIALKKGQSQEATQKAIQIAIQNAYNKATGTSPDQSTVERIANIATQFLYREPMKGINWAIEQAKKQLSQ